MEVVDVWGLERPPRTAKPIGKGGGLRPAPSPVGFAVGGARLDPRNRRSPGPEALLGVLVIPK